MSGYVLTAEDDLIVRETTKGVPDDQRAKIVAIHRHGIEAAVKRKAQLDRELQAVERIIALRSASLVALGEALDSDGGKS